MISGHGVHGAPRRNVAYDFAHPQFDLPGTGLCRWALQSPTAGVIALVACLQTCGPLSPPSRKRKHIACCASRPTNGSKCTHVFVRLASYTIIWTLVSEWIFVCARAQRNQNARYSLVRFATRDRANVISNKHQQHRTHLCMGRIRINSTGCMRPCRHVLCAAMSAAAAPMSLLNYAWRHARTHARTLGTFLLCERVHQICMASECNVCSHTV